MAKLLTPPEVAMKWINTFSVLQLQCEECGDLITYGDEYVAFSDRGHIFKAHARCIEVEPSAWSPQ